MYHAGRSMTNRTRDFARNTCTTDMLVRGDFEKEVAARATFCMRLVYVHHENYYFTLELGHSS